ncbi:MAG: hypothetical protein KAS32_20745, partial [Candidatus Peribacteraceae bacterium]|nr:hypothetical protein [Candidatus Peribacteraceae bacterium]
MKQLPPKGPGMKKNNDYLIKSRELTIENTTFCGANCIMCPRDKYSFKWRHMETEFYKDIIDQAIELGMLSLDACGFGDPLIDPKFEEKLAYVKKNYPQVKIYISTTAQMLDEKRLEWVCRYVDTLKVSHYGFSKNIFE